ncbi:hypothetical protein GF324_06590, partial [bacterium]|nr:hypothetical protein [bacterium]
MPNTAKSRPGPIDITIPRWVLWGVPIALVFLIRLPYFGLTTLNSDEGLYAVTARIMQEGGLPYRDAWDHAAPGIFYLYYFIFNIFGAWTMGAVRLAALVFHAAAGLIAGNELRRRHGDLAGLVASTLTIVATGGYLPADAVAGLTEVFMLPFLLQAAVWVIRYAEGETVRPWQAAPMIALAAWFKIHGLLIVLFFLAAAFVVRTRMHRNWAEPFVHSAAVLLISAATYFILVLPLFISGGLNAYLDIYI